MAAAGPYILPAKAKLNKDNATNLLNPANSFAMTLHTVGFVPNDTTNEVYADLTNELPTGGGYVSGGVTLTGVTMILSGGSVIFSHAPVSLPVSGAGIPAFRYVYIRALGTLNGKVGPLFCHALGDATPQDVPATTVGTLAINPPPGGVMVET